MIPIPIIASYLHYGLGPKRVPLQDVLHYALKFAQTSPKLDTPAQSKAVALQKLGSPARPVSPNEVEMDSPKSQDSCVR